jgi:DNA-binding response OmpR family regulator
VKKEPDTNFIGVHLFNLRRKLAEVKKDAWLQTIRNSGFVFKDPQTSYES